MKNLADITPAQFRRAAEIREQVDTLAHELHVIFGASEDAISRNDCWTPKQRARYEATIRSRKPSPLEPRSMSAETKAKISAAAKRRWAKSRKSGHNKL